MVIDFAALSNMLEREARGVLDETEKATLAAWRVSRGEKKAKPKHAGLPASRPRKTAARPKATAKPPEPTENELLHSMFGK